MTRARTLLTTLGATLLTLIALTTNATATARTTWSNRKTNDRGEILDWVVIAAGVVSLAILAMAYIRPIVMRYLHQIQ